jgi:cytochrome c-type protein NapC
MAGEGGSWGRRVWRALRRPSTTLSLGTLLLTGFVVGIVFWGGFHTALEATNTTTFCISCHEMRDTVYKEYQETVHYGNRSGVRAGCPDCHVPHEWGPKMLRKARASLELWGAFTGKIDTPAKFEAERMAMATREWERMTSSNSRECRNCHSFDGMSPEAQKQSNYKRHMKAKDEGKTCIGCHKGIAHNLPAEYQEPDED